MPNFEELKLNYNFADDRYYLYYGEDYVIDTKDSMLAFKALNHMIAYMHAGLTYNEARSRVVKEI